MDFVIIHKRAYKLYSKTLQVKFFLLKLSALLELLFTGLKRKNEFNKIKIFLLNKGVENSLAETPNSNYFY